MCTNGGLYGEEKLKYGRLVQYKTLHRVIFLIHTSGKIYNKSTLSLIRIVIEESREMNEERERDSQINTCTINLM